MAYSGDELIGIGYGINLEVPLLIYHIIYAWGIFGVFHKKGSGIIWPNIITTLPYIKQTYKYF